MTGIKRGGTEPSIGAVFASASNVGVVETQPRAGSIRITLTGLLYQYRSAVAIPYYMTANPARPCNVNPVARAKEH